MKGSVIKLDIRTQLQQVEHRHVVVPSLIPGTRIEVLLQSVGVNDFRLSVLDIDTHNIIELRRGDVIEIIQHSNVRICVGEKLCNIIRYESDNIIKVNLSTILCRSIVRQGFVCRRHSSGEYADYLRFVFGLTKECKSPLSLVPHMLYALYFGTNLIKVGIANAMKNVLRMYEQPFLYGSILAFLENAVKARELEIELSMRHGLVDRYSTYSKLMSIRAALTKDERILLQNYLMNFYSNITPILRAKLGHLKNYIPIVTWDQSSRNIIMQAVIYQSLRPSRYEIEDFSIGCLCLKDLDRNEKVCIPYQSVKYRVLSFVIKK